MARCAEKGGGGTEIAGPGNGSYRAAGGDRGATASLWYTRGDVGSQAFAQGAIGEEEPAQVTADDYSSSLGPWTQVNIPAVGAPLLACPSISSKAGAFGYGSGPSSGGEDLWRGALPECLARPCSNSGGFGALPQRRGHASPTFGARRGGGPHHCSRLGRARPQHFGGAVPLQQRSSQAGERRLWSLDDVEQPGTDDCSC